MAPFKAASTCKGICPCPRVNAFVLPLMQLSGYCTDGFPLAAPSEPAKTPPKLKIWGEINTPAQALELPSPATVDDDPLSCCRVILHFLNLPRCGAKSEKASYTWPLQIELFLQVASPQLKINHNEGCCRSSCRDRARWHHARPVTRTEPSPLRGK